MSARRLFLTLLAAVLIPQAASALATEYFGNAPIMPSQWGLAPEVAGVANLPTRVYWYEVNGSPSFYYRGDTAALNAALRAFAKLPDKDKEIHLVAGPGETKDLGQKKGIAFDWSVHVAGVLEQAVGSKQPIVMIVHVTVPKPPGKPDETAINALIADLDHPAFATREAAAKKLRELHYTGVPYIKAALKTTESVEARQRLEGLLTRLKGIYLPLTELPTGVTLLGPQDVYERHVARLRDPADSVRARAILGLAATRGNRPAIVKELEKFLAEEVNHDALRCAAIAAATLGADAKPLLPAMKKRIATSNVDVSQAFVKAVNTIEAAKSTPSPTDTEKQLDAIETEIQKTVKELRGAAKTQ
ncbi:hypothetical protein [Limnoglobus roseus]|uniref:HEAT repeat domain-containing protein n=1 Tax=Limnoglobus roseus TaxID=2598579 RepID=A0A5C1ALR7_9BACT|nr:hypothetical protein [Limnoglobus roseus]QEL20161.1 hypothetical protein PX52LOC_07249 [Limnoglobus roseus]